MVDWDWDQDHQLIVRFTSYRALIHSTMVDWDWDRDRQLIVRFTSYRALIHSTMVDWDWDRDRQLIVRFTSYRARRSFYNGRLGLGSRSSVDRSVH